MLFLPSFIFNTNRKYTTSIIAQNTLLPSPKELIQVITTFILVTIGWVLFRSETIVDAFNYLNQMIFEINIPKSNRAVIPYVIILIMLDFIIRKNERLKPYFLKHFIYVDSLYLISILYYFNKNSLSEFIYFAF